MDIDSLIDRGVVFFQANPLWAILSVVAIAAVIFWKPKAVFKVALAVFVIYAFIYVFSVIFDLASRGVEETKKFTTTPDIKVD